MCNAAPAQKSQNPRNVANIMLLCAFGDNMPFKQKSFDGGCILPFMHFLLLILTSIYLFILEQTILVEIASDKNK